MASSSQHIPSYPRSFEGEPETLRSAQDLEDELITLIAAGYLETCVIPGDNEIRVRPTGKQPPNDFDDSTQ